MNPDILTQEQLDAVRTILEAYPLSNVYQVVERQLGRKLLHTEVDALFEVVRNVLQRNK